LARLFGIREAVSEKSVVDYLWKIAEELLPISPAKMPVYTQALMDFGATWCTAKQPVCVTQKASCPFERTCQARAQDQVLAIPKKVPKKKSPQFQCAVAIVTNRNAVLLQKRPANAIWGGLWSLPESSWQPQVEGLDQPQLPADGWDATQLLNAVLEKRAAGQTPAFDAQEVRTGARIKHVFSHRILQIQAYEMTLNAKAKKELDLALCNYTAQLTWARMDRLEQYGLAQPIRLLLENWSRARDAAQ
jgi:A/G-specific adenine glycosylase